MRPSKRVLDGGRQSSANLTKVTPKWFQNKTHMQNKAISGRSGGPLGTIVDLNTFSFAILGSALDPFEILLCVKILWTNNTCTRMCVARVQKDNTFLKNANRKKRLPLSITFHSKHEFVSNVPCKKPWCRQVDFRPCCSIYLLVEFQLFLLRPPQGCCWTPVFNLCLILHFVFNMFLSCHSSLRFFTFLMWLLRLN